MLRVLPPGETIQITPGHAYGFDGKVKTSHTKADLFDLAASHGLKVATYGESPEADGYRRVVAIALAVGPASLPWSLPAPLSWFDESGLVEATEETSPQAATAAIVAATTPTPASVPTSAIPASPARKVRLWPIIPIGAGLLLVGDALSGEGLIARLFRRRRQ